MTCSKCNGLGRFFKEIFPGVTEVNPCLCEASENVRAVRKTLLEQEHLHNLERIQEAKEQYGIAL